MRYFSMLVFGAVFVSTPLSAARAEPANSLVFDPAALGAPPSNLNGDASKAGLRNPDRSKAGAPLSSALSQDRGTPGLSRPPADGSSNFDPNRLPLANSPLAPLPNSSLGFETERRLKLEEIGGEGTPRFDEERRRSGLPFIGLSIRAPTQ